MLLREDDDGRCPQSATIALLRYLLPDIMYEAGLLLRDQMSDGPPKLLGEARERRTFERTLECSGSQAPMLLLVKIASCVGINF
jgi:hypothetical protein